ncbi:MAG TPA: dodecin domain-containing protein [Thermoplasmata archaeon]|nr:dodecin domain-containing protein [Thermoplasmata archaeon]
MPIGLFTEGAMCEVRHSDSVESAMVQKIIDVAGSSPASFAKAAENAVASAAETVRNLKWARVSELEMELEGKKVKSYRVTVRIYFDVER